MVSCRRCLNGVILNRQSTIRNGQFDCFPIDFSNEAGNSHAFTTNRIPTMAQTIFHPSIEGAQHGAKSLDQFLDYAKKSGASGAQPSNYMLQADKGFKTAKEIQDTFAKTKMILDGISAHCPFWVHTTAWTGSPSIRPFIPADVAKKPAEEIEKWAEDYLLRLLDLSAELGVKVLPMFWGAAFGWELATGYPWGFWTGGDYDLIKEGQDRFVKKTAKLREQARKRGIYLCHEIHPGTAAMCADDFNMLVEICDGDQALAVNADPALLGRRKLGDAFPESRLARLRLSLEKFRHPSRRAAAQDGAGLAKARDAI